MERPERIARWRSLMAGVVASDVNSWRDDFVAALRAAHEPSLPLFGGQALHPKIAPRPRMAAPPSIEEVGRAPARGYRPDPRLA